jgi:hypothetical protein
MLLNFFIPCAVVGEKKTLLLTNVIVKDGARR